MKAPKCKLCGHEHWANAPHTFAKGAQPTGKEIIERIIAKKINKEKRRNKVTRAILKPEPASNSASNKQRWERAKYNAHMKDYMAKRRAGKKRK